MKNNYISYYELLTMVKKDNIPQLLILHLVPNKSVEYVSNYDYVNSDFVGYEILNDKDEDENYSYHLGDCFLESTMFDKIIEIIEEEKEIEKIDLFEELHDILNSPNKSIVLNAIHKCLVVEKCKINKLIDEVKKLKEEQ